jgi:hypothetical protein
LHSDSDCEPERCGLNRQDAKTAKKSEKHWLGMCADQPALVSALIGVNRQFQVFLGGLGVLAVRFSFLAVQ